jgi:hypothetical protein
MPAFADVHEPPAQSQRETTRLALLEQLTAVISPDASTVYACKLDDSIRSWAGIETEDRAESGDCPSCNLVVIESDWMRYGYGNQAHKAKGPTVAPCRGCMESLDVDLNPLQVFYTEPTIRGGQNVQMHSAVNVARERAKIRKHVSLAEKARCAFFDRNSHPRMPLVPTPARLKRAGV